MNADRSELKWLLIAGCSILLMAVLAGFAYGFAHAEIYRVGNPALTLTLLHENLGVFKLEVVAWILVFLLDIVVSISLYEIYKNTHKSLALLTSGLRLAYTAALGVSIVVLAKPLMKEIDASQVLASFESFERLWNGGLILFGVHLVVLSIVTFKSNFTPKFFSAFLLLGGVSYIVVHVLKTFSPATAATTTIESVLLMPMALSELLFGIWLIIKYFSCQYDSRRAGV